MIRKKILVVDDDESMRELLAYALSTLSGVDVLVAKDGQAGLEMFRASHPCLVITDMNMPRMNGLELLQAIGAEVPVIVMTGFGVKAGEAEHRAMEKGAAAFFIKPFSAKEFMEEVKKILMG